MSDHSRIHAGPWVGGVTETRAVIKAGVRHDGDMMRLRCSTDPDFQNNVRTVEAAPLWAAGGKEYPYKIARFEIDGLTPDTLYHYQPEFDGVEAVELLGGSFRTFPADGTRADFRFAFASCSNSSEGLLAPNGLLNTFRAALWGRAEVYTALHDAEPNLRVFCHLGDFHYGDIHGTNIAPHLEQRDVLLRRAEPRRLFRHLPLALTWDDHDFLGNNVAGGDADHCSAAQVSRNAYEISTPHYPLISRNDGIYQAFTYGRVRFLLTDTRFNKRSGKNTDAELKTVLGAAQKQWLKNEMRAGKAKFDLVVWLNPIGWIGDADPDSTLWAGYADERQELAEFLVAHDIRNVCMLSGDAHKLAIDDGRHAGYAAGGRGGFPVFHAAALEGMPSEKRGCYSHGDTDNGEGDGIGGTGQYGVVEVRYTNGIAAPPHVFWEAKRVDKNAVSPATLLRHDFPAHRTYDGF